MGEAMEERRKYPRETCLISAHVRMGKRIHDGTVLNLCEDGCFVATTAAFDLDSPIQLRFRHPRSNAMVKARAVVTRPVRPGEGRLGMGLALVDTLTALEPSAGATVSHSGTWSRPELATRSGTWATFDEGLATDRIEPGRRDLKNSEIVDRRGQYSEDTARTPAGRRRIRLQLSGGSPIMGLLLDISETGFSVASEPCPPVGKLLKMDMTYEGRAISITAKAIWRGDASGGLRVFGGSVLKFGGKDDRVAWRDLIDDLRRTTPGG